GVGRVKMISPSPVDRFSPARQPGAEIDVGCRWQSQIYWLKEYSSACNCLNDMWAINVHDHNCSVADGQTVANDIPQAFPGKNLFWCELGCNTNDEARHSQYLKDFADWAHGQGDVGFLWSAVNWVDTPHTTLSINGQLTEIGQAFSSVQQKYPPVSN
ncbi:hypothetical protein K469DRAFT_548003, partial [Zopfia rhizophila CBS 207.26]